MAAKKKTARRTAKRSGMVSVTLVKGSEQSIRIKSGMTLEAFLNQQGESLESRVSVNGNEAKLSTKLRKGDIVLITPAVNGGNA